MTLAVLLIVLPLAGAFLCLAGPERLAKAVGLLAGLAVLGVAVALAFDFPAWGTGNFWPDAEGWRLFTAFGVDFRLGTDSVGMLLILLTALSAWAWALELRGPRPSNNSSSDASASDAPKPEQLQYLTSELLLRLTAIGSGLLLLNRALLHPTWHPLQAHVDGLVMLAAL